MAILFHSIVAGVMMSRMAIFLVVVGRATATKFIAIDTPGDRT